MRAVNLAVRSCAVSISAHKAPCVVTAVFME
jgi:hypothetical protein